MIALLRRCLAGMKQHFIASACVVSTLALTGFSLFQTPADVKLAEQILAAGEKLYTEGKYKQAADTLAKSTVLFEQSDKPIDQVRSTNLQAECLANLGQCDLAGTLLQRSLAILQVNNDKKILAETYYYLSRQTGGCARKFDDAIKLMAQSLEIKRTIYAEGDPALAYDYTFLGYVYNSKGMYDSALIYLDQAMAIRTKHLESGDIETAQTLFNLAASYEGKSQLGKALSFNQRALLIRVKTLGASHATVSNSVNSIGRVYRKLGNNERALEYYREALEIRKNTLGATHPNVAGSYYEIGNLYGNISNYHAAIEYIQQGNQILENNAQVANDVLPTYYAFIGKMYGQAGMHDNAIASIEKGINVAEKKLPETHLYRAIVYNIAGEYYGEIGEIRKQSEFFKKAIAIYKSAYGAGSEREGDVISKMAATSAKLGRNSEALALYGQALSFYKNKLGDQNPKTASVYLGIGDVYNNNRNFGQAKESYALALQSLANPADGKSIRLKIMRSEARMYTLDSNPKKALEAYQGSVNLAEEISQGYNNEAARIQLEKEKRELHVAAMNVAWELYAANADLAILGDAFSMVEKSKATLLLENTKDQQAKTMAGVPDSLIEKERDLRIELAYYKTNLYLSKKAKDTSATTAFEKNIFDSERELERFKLQLEQEFPAYFQLKYSRGTIDVVKVQQRLPVNTTVLEYFVGDSAIYCFEISRSSVQLRNLKLDDEFKTAFAGYQKSLTDARFIVNNPQKADSLYFSTAQTLYNALVPTLATKEQFSMNASGPPSRTDKPQKLIIIPDDFLAQLNFGTLLYETPNTSNYAALPYLVNKCVISYAYSSSFYGDAAEGSKKKGNDFAGFAPSYVQSDYSALDSNAHPMTALAMRDGNFPLPGATEEVNIISKMMSGRSWIDEQATETNFKKFSGNYDVLHLAMHSLLNDDEPRYSELLFNNRSDTENDGFLTIAEIYNLKLDAQLVVLSACSSGFGKIQHGEGSISLSRAFSYAGCPSVVMSLWKVPDQITTNIMKNFYESLNEGLSKDEALREAQLKFTRENTDPLYRHPYYWAGFVVIGDTAPLQLPSNFVYYFSAALIFAVVGFLFQRKRRSRSC